MQETVIGMCEKPPRTFWTELYLFLRVRAIRLLAWVIRKVLLPNPNPFTRMTAINPDTGNKVPCVVFHPPNRDDYSSLEGNERSTPVYINLHGGGWVGGAALDDSEFCKFVSAQTPCVVVSVEYKLAPEHPFPQPVDDCVDVVRWVRRQFSTSRICIGGFSAGGTLALAASVHPDVAQRDGGVSACVAFFSPADISERALHDFPEHNPYKKQMFYEAYLRDTPPNELTNPLVSPLYAQPTDFPPTVLFIATDLDPNKKNIAAFFEKMAAARPPSDNPKAPRFVGVTMPTVHGWTHISEFILKKLGTSKEAGGAGTGFELKWEAFNLVVKELRRAFSVDT